jgi:hypothetical protein
VGAFPSAYDLQRLVEFDYMTVHSGDLRGPKSLHAPVPLRSGELLVRRGLVERGLLLMMSRNLVTRSIGEEGILYTATDAAAAFLDTLQAPYLSALRERADWAVTEFGELSTPEITARTSSLFHSVQFEAPGGGGVLI